MRWSHPLLGALVLAGCGPDPVALCAQGGCDEAFARILRVDVSSPGGTFQVLRNGLSERRTFATGALERGRALSRGELAPLWLQVSEPSFQADLRAASQSRQCTSLGPQTRRCLQVRGLSSSTLQSDAAGCWCGMATSSRVESAWQEALVVFDLAF
ncbi:MAG: hypothetical protein AMXMBFR34_19490 [Myxococcaceae bacterium]